MNIFVTFLIIFIRTILFLDQIFLFGSNLSWIFIIRNNSYKGNRVREDVFHSSIQSWNYDIRRIADSGFSIVTMRRVGLGVVKKLMQKL